MELIKGKNVSLLLGYDLEKKRVRGSIRYNGEVAGKVIGNEFFINANSENFKEISEECKALEDQVEDYCRMWEEHETR